MIAVTLQAQILPGAPWEEHLLLAGGFLLGGALEQLTHASLQASTSKNTELPSMYRDDKSGIVFSLVSDIDLNVVTKKIITYILF